jgi:hypothetical protein
VPRYCFRENADVLGNSPNDLGITGREDLLNRSNLRILELDEDPVRLLDDRPLTFAEPDGAFTLLIEISWTLQG